MWNKTDVSELDRFKRFFLTTVRVSSTGTWISNARFRLNNAPKEVMRPNIARVLWLLEDASHLKLITASSETSDSMTFGGIYALLTGTACPLKPGELARWLGRCRLLL